MALVEDWSTGHKNSNPIKYGAPTSYSNKSREELRDEIHLVALDSIVSLTQGLDNIVSLNFLCVASSFLGLSLTTIGLRSMDGHLDCDPNINTIKSLMLFEVISFAFFLTSSLVAYDLKIMISLVNAAELNEEFRSHFNRKSIRKVMLCVIFSSILGCLFLILSIVYILQIRLGILSRKSPSTV
ncbi:hypothetical protein CK203_114594 [Vitis vinifera]|uniref:Uncharacterized protein n=1 Tax=Vitis vinifera TaxID=29760 RepID=A0A438C863_VITVI|nr:hypothetical protein CK203_114594 [Vitis vinifera]